MCNFNSIQIMLNFRPRIDLPLLLAISLLILLGSLTVWSASGFSEPMLERHLIRALISLTALIIMSTIPPIKYQHTAPYLYGLTIILLLGVIIMGDSTNGSQRWLALGPARFQPSELVKVAIPMMIAWMLVVDPGRPNLKKIILCLIVTAIPAGLIFIQPDLDGAIFTVTYALFVLYFSGMSWKIISSFLAIIATTIPMLWFFL